MIGHHAPSKNGPAIPLLDVANDLYELDRLVRIREDRFTARYPVVHVVQTTLNNNPWPAHHLWIPQQATYHNFLRS